MKLDHWPTSCIAGWMQEDRKNCRVNIFARIINLSIIIDLFSFILGQRFYVIGGISSGMACKDVECYDGLTQQWLTNVPSLQKPLYGAACVVLPILV